MEQRTEKMDAQRYQTMMNYITNGSYPSGYTPNLKRALRKAVDSYIIKNGMLYHLRDAMYLDDMEKRKEAAQLVIVDQEEKNEILHQAHINPAGGHFGMKATTARLAETYWWPGHSIDVKELVQNCLECKKTTKSLEDARKHPRPRPKPRPKLRPRPPKSQVTPVRVQRVFPDPEEELLEPPEEAMDQEIEEPQQVILRPHHSTLHSHRGILAQQRFLQPRQGAQRQLQHQRLHNPFQGRDLVDADDEIQKLRMENAQLKRQAVFFQKEKVQWEKMRSFFERHIGLLEEKLEMFEQRSAVIPPRRSVRNIIQASAANQDQRHQETSDSGQLVGSGIRNAGNNRNTSRFPDDHQYDEYVVTASSSDN